MAEKKYILNSKSFSSQGAVNIQVQQGSKESTLEIAPRELISLLKEWAAAHALYWEKNRLLPDFFTKSQLHFSLKVEEDCVHISARVHSGKQDFALSECSAICRSSPLSLIRRSFLKVFDPGTSWHWLKWAWEEPERLLSCAEAHALMQEWDEEEQPYTCEGELSPPSSPTKDPEECSVLPVLRLSDRLGAFAALWMHYVDRELPFHHPLEKKEKRQRAAEEDWEKDLLETDFIKKMVGESHYYCPVDKVAKSLAFLLELGWKVYDYEGKEVCLQTQTALTVQTEMRSLQLKGTLSFGDYQAPIQDMLGNFNRRQHFLNLSEEKVGLVTDIQLKNSLSSLVEEGEVLSDGVRLPRSHAGLLIEGFPELQTDHLLEKLKSCLQSFTGLDTKPPPSSFLGTLRPYQQQGVDWLCFLKESQFSGLLADDMGLGKTVQVLAFLSHYLSQQTRPVLIIVPRSLLFHWREESCRFLPSARVYIHHGVERCQDEWEAHDLILTTYSTFRHDAFFLGTEWEAVILDEAQSIKNADSKTAKASYQLQAPFKLCITGTPVENHLGELWSLFHFLIPDLLGKRKSFEATLNAATSDFRHLECVKSKIKPFFLRRNKEEVAPDLPEKIEQVIHVEMDDAQRKVYEDFLAGVKNGVLKKVSTDGMQAHRMEILEALLRLRQICCHPLLVDSLIDAEVERSSAKWRALFMDLETLMETGNKVLIYSQFTQMLSLIRKEVKNRSWKHVYLDGQSRDREAVVHQFQNDPDTQLFLISLKAGGVGLNLTAADAVLIYDPWWNQAAENQAIDRAHRIGRKGTVLAKRYITRESVEEKIQTLKSAKAQISQSLMDGADEALQLDSCDLEFLLQS